MPPIDFLKIKKGDFLIIRYKKFEVMSTQIEADAAFPPDFKSKTFFIIYLRDVNNKTMQTTHELGFYEDHSEIFFSQTGKEKEEISFDDISAITPNS